MPHWFEVSGRHFKLSELPELPVYPVPKNRDVVALRMPIQGKHVVIARAAHAVLRGAVQAMGLRAAINDFRYQRYAKPLAGRVQ